MTTLGAFVKRHPVLTYFVLAFVLSFGSVLIVFGPTGLPVPLEQATTIGTAMLVGPSVAGLLLTGLVSGRTGFRELLSRLLRCRVGARWYEVALLTAPLLATVLLLALSLTSPEFLPGILVADDKASALLLGIVAGLVVGVFEELGWTGFAIPRLRVRHGALATGLIVGVPWGVWHFPPFWQSDSFSAVLPLALLVGRLFAWLPAYRILMVWVYDRTESVLVIMLTHLSLVVSLTVIVPMSLEGAAALTWVLVWAAALWIVVAAVAVARRRQPARQPLRRQMA